MADIAILVAEEYERRVKSSGKNGAANEEINFFSSVSVLARGLGGSSNWINKSFVEDKMELLKWVLEPKTQIGLAAINGFFSA